MPRALRLAIIFAAGIACLRLVLPPAAEAEGFGGPAAANNIPPAARASGAQPPEAGHRLLEPRDNLIVRLPGPDMPAPRPVRPFTPPPPRPITQAPPVSLVLPAPALPAGSPDVRRIDPAMKRNGAESPKPELPAEILEDSSAYLQRQLGKLTEPDARQILGASRRHRTAIGANKKPDGDIYTFADPTGRYREFELDFDQKTGYLRTVFVYPRKMRWAECQRLWRGEVHTAAAANGRVFRSYVNRRLDVLVDRTGLVISLGFY